MEFDRITIEVNIAAPVGKVFTYYNEAEHIIHWNFASEEWHCPAAENNLKVGGKLKTRMEAKDGSFGFDFEGTYDEVLTEEKLTYSLADDRKVTTLFEEINGATKVTSIFDAEKENPIEMQKGGWQAILNNFKKYVEQG